MITKTAYTIAVHTPTTKFGIESSQLSRQELFKALGVKHELVIATILAANPNWVENLEKLGYTDYHHVILDKSDIARDKPSVTADSIDVMKVKHINKTKDGFVGSVVYKDGIIESYTSRLLYRIDRFSGYFELYNRDGSIVLSGNLLGLGSYYELEYKGKHCSEWDLVVEYLAEASNSSDIFITDLTREHPPVLKRFFTNTGRTLHRFVHFNTLERGMKFLYEPWCMNVVASPALHRSLLNFGLDPRNTIFLPAVHVDMVRRNWYDTITDWCMVGNMTAIKRVDMAIETFRQLPDLKLTIYGHLDTHVIETLPANVQYVTFQPTVPYSDHEGYLSCSRSELFANAAVEASSNGLVCLLSNVDVAHKHYAEEDPNVYTFNDVNELTFRLETLARQGGISASFAGAYIKEQVLSLYRDVFDL